MDHVTLTTDTWAESTLILHQVNSCTNFEVSTFIYSRDIVEGVKF